MIKITDKTNKQVKLALIALLVLVTVAICFFTEAGGLLIELVKTTFPLLLGVAFGLMPRLV